jgi:tetratricopeptide (TPR) repeat protein
MGGTSDTSAAPEDENAASFVDRGDRARNACDWIAARAHYETALRINPGLAPIWIQLGHAAKESGDYTAAECAYQRALALMPADADAHLQFGHLLKITGRLSAAFAFYQQALTLNPDLSDAKTEVEGLRQRRNKNNAVPAEFAPASPDVDGGSAFQILDPASLSGPDFLGIGMARAGTGWLFDQVRYHPEFWMPPIKEFGYLKRGVVGLKEHAKKRLQVLREGNTKNLAGWSNREPGNARDIAFLEEAALSIGDPLDMASYAALFRYKEGALSGDITPGYCALEPSVIRQLAQTLPKVKLILMVRDPVERAWSRISMWARLGTFDPSIAEKPAALADFLNTDKRLKRESFPSIVAQRWKTHAPSLEFRSFFFDDLVQEPERLRRDILLYLGADPDKSGTQSNFGHNRKAKKRPNMELAGTARSVLIAHFRDELLACADVFGGAAERWPRRHGL